MVRLRAPRPKNDKTLPGSQGAGCGTLTDVRVAVVGAGIAGLASAKVLSGVGHAVVVFEKAPDVGGVWSASRRYPGLRTQNSKRTYCFSDFPMPRDYPQVPTGAQMQAYLDSYVDRFGFRDRIHCDAEVVSAELAPTGGWVLHVRELTTGRMECHQCDHLVIANGVFSTPVVPRYAGHDDFVAGGGLVCHTSEFHDAGTAFGRHVVVLGYGKSACDVAEAVSRVAASTTVIARRLLWKMPRRVRLLGNYESVALTRFGEAGFGYLEPNRFERFYNGRGRRVRDAVLDMVQAVVTRQLRLRGLGLEPSGRFEQIAQSTASLVTECFFEHVSTGQIVVRRDTEIARLRGDQCVELSTGERIHADIVLCATGFRQQVGFLDASVQRQLIDPAGNFRLYRQIVPSGVPALTFAGYNSSMLSALGAEIAAVWTAALLRGDLVLPTVEDRDADIDRRLLWMIHRTAGHHASGALVSPFNIHNIDDMLNDLGRNISPFRRALQWVLPVDPRSYRNRMHPTVNRAAIPSAEPL